MGLHDGGIDLAGLAFWVTAPNVFLVWRFFVSPIIDRLDGFNGCYQDDFEEKNPTNGPVDGSD